MNYNNKRLNDYHFRHVIIKDNNNDILDRDAKWYYLDNCLKFSCDFNKSIDNINWSFFENKFSDSPQIENLQDLIKQIIFGYDFNQPIENVIWPKNLECLHFGTDFNQPIEKLKFSEKLSYLILTGRFNQTVNFENEFNPELYIYIDISRNNIVTSLPNKLKYLEMATLNRPLLNLPCTLEKLFIFNDSPYHLESYKKHIENSRIPYGCEVTYI